MKSLPTIQQPLTNEQRFYDLLRAGDPYLYFIKMVLDETQVNPMVLPKIIRALANLAYGTGYGRVQVFMENGVVTNVKPEESSLVNLKVIRVEEKTIIK
jgi:hypothetical protein